MTATGLATQTIGAAGNILDPAEDCSRRMPESSRRGTSMRRMGFWPNTAAALVLARFVPIVRTYVPPVVGMSTMHYRTFLMWNAIGGVVWALSLTLAGFWLGQIPFVANNVDVISIILIVISIAPIGFDLLRRRQRGIRAR